MGCTTVRRKYPVLYLTDAVYNFQRAVLAEVELARSGHIPESDAASLEKKTEDELSVPQLHTRPPRLRQRGG